MKRSILVWDLPTRLFHWLLAASVLGAFAIGKLVDDDQPTFAVHMLLGATAAFLVVLRIVWGLVGSRHARFASFAFGPRAILSYFRGLFTKDANHYVGHNPGSSVAIFAMLALTVGTAATGVLMSSSGEAVEELHELFANALIFVAVAHVAGVLLHTLRHRENLTSSMIVGKKLGKETDAIPSSHPLAALLLVALTTSWVVGLARGYDAGTGTVRVPLLGATVTVGEGAEGDGAEAYEREEEDDD
ncbi:MAG: cytochrome b/b6 domain-containing protein [Myxococcales bacterium]|nr:cytochrome b/b6 domain-containing protein [Myxococcales bacterium]